MKDFQDTPEPRLTLASSSPYRRALLERLGLPFQTHSPVIDEVPRRGEDAPTLALRLAYEKAAVIARQNPHAVVIGSDQVAARGNTLLGKPGNADAARRQLLESSGQEVSFHTAVVVLDGARRSVEREIDETRVAFRTLTPAEIDRYVEAERPFDCAGGFKAECLGISLFWRIQTEDPTALTGLPLIWLAGALRRCGFAIP